MRSLLTILLLFCHSVLFSQTYWAKKQGGGNVDETLAIASDASGNSYTTGYFSTSATINETTLNVNGLTDIFVTKINASGTSTWAKSAGGSSSDRGLGIAVAPNGDVVVCGFFTGTVNFGNVVSLTSNANSQDAFVVRYNSSGTVIWAKAGGSSGNADRANAVAVDSQGNVIITGQYSGAASFGPLNISSVNTSNDVFIVKYDPSGNEIWAKSGSGADSDRGLSITTDNSNNVYAVGQFSGNITFDNPYSNTILNALFLIKYSPSGNEEWFRWAGGSDQSIANGVCSDGTNVYLTGDFGSSISFLGGGTSTLNSGFANAVFVAAYSQSGGLLWKTSQGSGSAVSARAISVRGGAIGVAGWYNCTFESLSDEYGESNFNSLGYKDAFVMRYSSSGTFDFARNFGSQSDDICTGITLLPDGHEVITGSCIEDLIIPVSSPVPAGLSVVNNAPNVGLTYCGDPNYGLFGALNISDGSDLDGFTIKAIDPARSPFDYYKRFGGGCDLSIPESCISQGSAAVSYECAETIIGCPTYAVTGNNFIVYNSPVGYDPNFAWVPASANDAFLVSQPGTVSVTITSEDGCYSHNASVEVDLYDPAEIPLLSDNAVVNTMSADPEPIYLCPGESVNIWADFPDSYTFYWQGPGIAQSGQTNNEIITVTDPGNYSITVLNENGCKKSVQVLVVVHEVPPENVEPYLVFGTESDTLYICGNSNFLVHTFDHLTGEQVESTQFDWTWTISSPGSIFQGGSTTTGHFTEDGWYIVEVEFETEDNPCVEIPGIYTAIDSIYVIALPVPEVNLILTGPPYACPGDTLTLILDYEGDSLYTSSNVIQNFGDSLYVFGPGIYSAGVSSTNEYGCVETASDQVQILPINSPQIFSDPVIPVICPGDSVQLFTPPSPGDIVWQGPSGNISDTTVIYVHQAGSYYTEVTFYEGCALVSNTIDVLEYATPYIAGNDGIMCPGVPLEISIESPSISNIVWLDPLSGSDSVQVITEPGIYTAQVTSCDITAEVSIQIEMDTNTVSIFQPDMAPTCAGDSIFIQAVPDSYPVYSWSPQGSGSGVFFTDPSSIYVVATDEFGCELESNTFTINFEPLPLSPVFEYTLVCEGETQTVILNSANTINFVNEPGGEIIQNDPVVTIPEFLNDTTFYVYLSSEYCVGPLDSLHISPKPYPDAPILATNAPVCTGTSVNLVVLNPDDQAVYNWLSPSGNGFSGDDVNYFVQDISQEGIYTCFADLDGCLSDTIPIPVSLFETVQLVLPPDTGMCYRGEFTVAPNAIFQSYIWQDGSTDSIFYVSETTEIFLIVRDFNNCQSYDGMHVELVDCNLDIPNVFTPNGDGKNDFWFVSIDQPLYVQIIVFNRWGTKVFESNDLLTMWDGKNYNTDKDCSEGVYFYILKLADFEGTNIEKTGTITLLKD